MPRLLIISGLDPSGGAGFIADSACATSLGITPTGSVTAFTEQNKSRLTKISYTLADTQKAMLRAITEEAQPDAVKIGMVGRLDMAQALYSFFIDFPMQNIVLDPLFISTTGVELNDIRAIRYMAEKFFPISTLITPNANEAKLLSDYPVLDAESAMISAKRIFERFNPKAVLVKCGDIDGEPLDVFYSDDIVATFYGIRQKGSFHGTGCMLSTAIASLLASGAGVFQAVCFARQYLIDMMKNHKQIWQYNGKRHSYSKPQ